MIKGVLQESDTNKFGYGRIKVDGTWFGADKKGAPKGKSGDMVSFEPFTNDRGYDSYKAATLKVEAAPVTTPGAAPAAPYKPVAASKDAYWEQKAKDDATKEPRIAYLAALDRAIEYVDLAIRAGCFKSLEKAKEADKLGILQSFVDETTQRFVLDTYAQEAPVLDEDTALPLDSSAESANAEVDQEKWK